MKEIKLPKNWKIEKVSNIANLIRGINYKKETASNNSFFESLPILRANNINGDLNFEDLVYVPKSLIKSEQLIKKDDIIFAMSSGSKHLVGKTAVAKNDFKGSYGAFCALLRINEGINKKYVSYIFKGNNYRKLISEIAKGTSINNLKREHILDFEFPLPPLETQHAIVSKIEELFSELDKGIAELKTAQQQLKTYRQSVLKSAFEGKLTNDNVKEGELPDGWEWKTIKEISTLLGDGLHGTPKYDSNGEYYFINGNNLNDGKIEIKENTKKVSKEEFEKYKKQLNNKTIFVSINGSIGYTAFYNDEPIILGKSACYINIKEGIDKHYIRYIFTSQRFTNYSISVATGSTIKNVSLKSMREFEVPLPETIGEQHQIVQEIESRLSVADRMEQSIQESLQKAEALRQSILKKAFSGELV